MSSLTPRIDNLEKNYIINGNFDFWQRGTTLTTIDAASRYLADRFYFFSNGNSPAANLTLSRSTDVPTPSSAKYSLKYQRNSGNTNVSGMFVGQAIESNLVRDLMGKECTISFYAKKGANYSPTNSLLQVRFETGTGTDQSASGAYTGSVVALSTSVTLTTSWQQFTIPVPVLNTNINEARMFFIASSIGTAGADDSFYMSGITLLNSYNPNIIPSYVYAAGNFAQEFQLCQRYFEKSYDADVAIGTVGRGIISCTFGSGAGDHFHTQVFRVEKRTTPAVTIYNGATGTAGQWSVISASFNGNALVNVNPDRAQVLLQGFSYNANLAARNHFYYTADAEL